MYVLTFFLQKYCFLPPYFRQQEKISLIFVLSWPSIVCVR
jgi:hypothetical protein